MILFLQPRFLLPLDPLALLAGSALGRHLLVHLIEPRPQRAQLARRSDAHHFAQLHVGAVDFGLQRGQLEDLRLIGVWAVEDFFVALFGVLDEGAVVFEEVTEVLDELLLDFVFVGDVIDVDVFLCFDDDLGLKESTDGGPDSFDVCDDGFGVVKGLLDALDLDLTIAESFAAVLDTAVRSAESSDGGEGIHIICLACCRACRRFASRCL